MNMKRNILFMLLLLCAAGMNAQLSTILGNWQTVDDQTGEVRAVVSIYQGPDGLFYGKIKKMLMYGSDLRCEACKGDDHDAPIVGLVIIRGMKYDKENNRLYGGKVLDPESGKFYYGKIYPQDGNLVLRGSLDKHGLFGRNQTWTRAR